MPVAETALRDIEGYEKGGSIIGFDGQACKFSGKSIGLDSKSSLPGFSFFHFGKPVSADWHEWLEFRKIIDNEIFHTKIYPNLLGSDRRAVAASCQRGICCGPEQ